MPCWDCQLSSINYKLSASLLNHDYIYPADSRPTVNGAHQSIFGRQSANFVLILVSFCHLASEIIITSQLYFSIGQHFKGLAISLALCDRWRTNARLVL